MRSGSRTGATFTVLATVLAPAALAGCVTTQRLAARSRLVDARIRASQVSVHVTRPNPHVRVVGLSLVRAGDGSALVVALRNTAPRVLTDVPISVGITAPGGRRTYLNRSAGIDYFATHVPSIGAGALVTWVFTSRRRLAAVDRPFADVGIAHSPASTVVAGLPRVEVARTTVVTGSRTLSLTVSNLSGIPQYSLQVYAVASRDGRDVGAGRATVAHIGSAGRTTIRMTLLGSAAAGGAALSLSALPTIFD